MNLQKLLEYVSGYVAIELWDANNAHETIIRVKDKIEIPTRYLKCKIEPNSIIASQRGIVISIITE